jgi:H+/Cl- antiporter ClcA
LDWYVEGPGRRVGYDDLTAIDWIFEYTKERQRLRILSSTTNGLVGYVRQLLDASHVWVVLILTGVAVGVLAAAINIASDWLSDIKFGFCKSGEQGGQFYLNKGFCCWGHDGPPSLVVIKMEMQLTSSRILSMSRLDTMATGFSYSIHRWWICGRVHLLHIVLGTTHLSSPRSLLMNHLRSFLPAALLCLSNATLFMRNTVAYQKSKQYWAGLSCGVLWAHGP